MPATRETKAYVEDELPYKLLIEIYKDSRRSLKELGRNLNISHHTISNTLKRLEKRYRLEYTLELDTNKLGFSEGRVVTIKFAEKPGLDFLRERLKKDVFVQDAYLAEGDFDLLLYVIGLTPREFASWQWRLRIELGRYRPLLKIATADIYNIGFLPIRNELIEMSTELSGPEKKILIALNSNSRMKLKELIQKSKTTQMRTIYALKKFKKEGIIKKFTALVQNPTKRIFMAYTLYVTPEQKHTAFISKFLEELVKEDPHQVTSDYDLVLDTVGPFDSLYMCTFDNGEAISKRGPDFQMGLLKEESPEMDRAVLTDVIAGRWPFHLDDYSYYKTQMKKGES